jgi:hypothetical protein
MKNGSQGRSGEMPLPWVQIARFIVTAGPVLKELAQGVNQLKKDQRATAQGDFPQRLAAVENQVAKLTKIQEELLARLAEMTQVLGAVQRSFRVLAIAVAGVFCLSVISLILTLTR